MMKSIAAVSLKVLLVVCVLAIGSSAVWAATITCPTAASANFAISGLIGNSCTIGDKVFSNFQDGVNGLGSIPSNWTVYFKQYLVSPGTYEFQFTIQQGPTNMAPGVYSFGYTLAIDPTVPGFAQPSWIYQVGVANDSQDTTTSKAVYTVGDGLVTTVSSSGGLVTDGLPNMQSLSVVETITVFGQVEPNSISDYFWETSVPEPASMALMGAGLLALGGLLRRKK